MRRKRRHAPDQIRGQAPAKHLQIAAAVQVKDKQFARLPGEDTRQAGDFLSRVIDRNAALAALEQERPKPARRAVPWQDRQGFVHRDSEVAPVLEQEPGKLVKLTGQILGDLGEVGAINATERPAL